MIIVAQNTGEVKNIELMPADLGLAECEAEWCHEPAFLGGLCLAHFMEERDHDYQFGDPQPPYGCGCVLPEQSCPDCEVAARTVYGGDELPF